MFFKPRPGRLQSKNLHRGTLTTINKLNTNTHSKRSSNSWGKCLDEKTYNDFAQNETKIVGDVHFFLQSLPEWEARVLTRLWCYPEAQMWRTSATPWKGWLLLRSSLRNRRNTRKVQHLLNNPSYVIKE